MNRRGRQHLFFKRTVGRGAFHGGESISIKPTEKNLHKQKGVTALSENKKKICNRHQRNIIVEEKQRRSSPRH